jgi:FtsH-binding integral membrane protein
MNKTILSVIIAGLIIMTSAVYFIEGAEELEEQDMVKAPFFLIVAIAYILVAILMLKKNEASYKVAIIGSIALIALYGITRTDMAVIFGMHAGGIGTLGIASKVLQSFVIIGSVISVWQIKKDAN